ncbi:MAG: hypothetical protein H6799_02605 [Candidatus Nomurabacteria bacterium]|nr:MAG: hypothetical protein H6799_02605 [Candidatus Nomurabacteria bacterium]HRV76319.1 hypothetical protein [Candidatus Saccharimonadales bacterium]
MRAEEEVELSKQKPTTTVTYICDNAQRKECGDLIVEAAVELENRKKT